MYTINGADFQLDQGIVSRSVVLGSRLREWEFASNSIIVPDHSIYDYRVIVTESAVVQAVGFLKGEDVTITDNNILQISHILTYLECQQDEDRLASYVHNHFEDFNRFNLFLYYDQLSKLKRVDRDSLNMTSRDAEALLDIGVSQNALIPDIGMSELLNVFRFKDINTEDYTSKDLVTPSDVGKSHRDNCCDDALWSYTGCSINSSSPVSFSPTYIEWRHESVFVSEASARNRLIAYTEGSLRHIFWDNVIMAGGSMSLILSPKLDTRMLDRKFKYSDIDLFVYGKNRRNTVKRLISEIRISHDCRVFQRGPVFTILIRNKLRPIQIIDSGQLTPVGVLESFDLSHCMVGFNGTNFVCLPSYLTTRIRNCSTTYRTHLKLYRIAKALKLGFSVEVPCKVDTGDDYLDVKDIDFSQLYKHRSVVSAFQKYMTYTNESDDRLLFLVRSLFSESYDIVKNDIQKYSGDWKDRYDTIEVNDVIIGGHIELITFRVNNKEVSKFSLSLMKDDTTKCGRVKLRNVMIMSCMLNAEEASKYAIKIRLQQNDISLIRNAIEQFISHETVESTHRGFTYVYPRIFRSFISDELEDTICAKCPGTAILKNSKEVTLTYLIEKTRGHSKVNTIADVVISIYAFFQGNISRCYTDPNMASQKPLFRAHSIRLK